MTNNIEQQDQDFFYNATNELINRTNDENSRLHVLIQELINRPTIITSTTNSNNIRASRNNVYEFPQYYSSPRIMSSNSIISTINESMNEKPSYKKVLSEEGKKSLTKVKYDKSKMDYDKCPILQSEFETGEEITQLPCKHCFNTSAIEHWLKEENSICPVCRYELDAVEKKYNTDTTDINENTYNEHDEETDNEDMDDEDIHVDDMEIEEENFDLHININNESSIFNLINSLERTYNFNNRNLNNRNLNNRNYYNSITEDAEIQEAILMSLTN